LFLEVISIKKARLMRRLTCCESHCTLALLAKIGFEVTIKVTDTTHKEAHAAMNMVNTLTQFKLLRAFESRNFALLWSGQMLSRIGDFVYEVALAWWVLEKTGSATEVAKVLICSFAPMLVFLLIGGVAVDRYPRVLVMLISDIGRGIIVTVVTIMAFTQQLEVWHIYIASILFGIVDAFFQPVTLAVVPDIVPDPNLPSANSLNSLATQLGRILGPAIGAAAAGWAGTSFAFGLNALTFFVSAAFLFPLLKLPKLNRQEGQPVEEEAQEGFWIQLREGLRFVFRTPWLWLSVLLFAFINVTLVGPYSVAMPFLVSENLGQDVRVLGLLYTFFPIGYVLGSLWLGGRPVLRHRGWLIYGGAAVAGAMLGLFGLDIPIFLMCAAGLVNGAALEVGALAWTNALQEFVPAEKLGRVASVDSLGSFALLPIGLALAGWATDLIGAPGVFLVGGGATMIVSLLLLWLSPIRKVLD
jgi:MFS family permease